MTAVFILEHLLPSIAGVPAIKMHNQIYGMPVLIYYTNLVPRVLLDMLDGLEKENEGKSTLERTYQLANYTEAIGKLILKEHPELECLVQLKDMAEKYQFFLRRLKSRTAEGEDKLQAIVGAEDDYCSKIAKFRKEHNLQCAYVFT